MVKLEGGVVKLEGGVVKCISFIALFRRPPRNVPTSPVALNDANNVADNACTWSWWNALGQRRKQDAPAGWGRVGPGGVEGGGTCRFERVWDLSRTACGGSEKRTRAGLN